LSGSNVNAEYVLKESYKAEADIGQISQVIQNLVINAKQSMPSGGKIKITCEDYIDDNEKKYLKISVKDYGIGISKGHLDKIFDPYFSTKQTGSGLGLSVCHSIIRRHEGKIFVESEIGAGTTFTILLPASYKELKAIVKHRHEIWKKLKILIMDDEKDIIDMLESLLFNLGHDVSNSQEGSQALKIYQDSREAGNPFDIVILDLTIKGGLGGRETVKRLREYDPNVKVIVSSGYADSSISRYKEDGFNNMLKKPYTIDELNEVIFQVMNEGALDAEKGKI
jgi:CheY-like chemotaxis protein